MKHEDPFYIGWEDKPAPSTQRRIWWFGGIWLIVIAALAGGLASSQQTILPRGVFEWGEVKTFNGIFRSRPYPHLEMARPHSSNSPEVEKVSHYPLVKPFKYGLTSQECEPWEGQSVTLRATLIYQPEQTMLEIVPGSIQRTGIAASVESTALETSKHSGQSVTLVGEIVDSKCYLGVMNPGRFLPHRACAIRCISGGIPPAFLVSSGPTSSECYLLVSSQGEPLSEKVLPWVARPVRLSGTLETNGDLKTFRADLSSIQSAE